MALSREMREAIQREVEARWMHRCDAAAGTGWGREYGRPREKFAMHQAGIRFEEYSVTQNGVKIATIQRRYAQRKVNGYYRELKPKVKFENAA